MPIPLDRLYHFIGQTARELYGDHVVIYRFWPHGSKNINDLNMLDLSSDWYTQKTSPIIWCIDQEPLDHEYYAQNRRDCNKGLYPSSLLRSKNLNYFMNIFLKNILLHSEKNSKEVEKYRAEKQLIPVYWWSHAIISGDWFRYAKYDNFKKNQATNKFLVRNRAWSGSREYRLKFADLLIANNLVSQCQTNFNAVDPEIGLHYHHHIYKNDIWCPNNVLEEFFSATQAPASSSADYVAEDYHNNDIEVVLETLFDDTRLHLTEKTLRPLACAQPFILAATPGSLKYLRAYGFKTFEDVWDESYDNINDPKQRMLAIIELMKTISCWDNITRQKKLCQAEETAHYNREWFFSSDFEKMIFDELESNLKNAFYEFQQEGVDPSFKEWCLQIQQYPNVRDRISSNTNKIDITWPQVNKTLDRWKNLLNGFDQTANKLK
jgi:hypothetical protein